MRDMGINVESLGIRIDAEETDKNSKYEDFYNKAIDDIASKIGVKNNGNIKM
jgi:hypothetical protein